MFMSVLPPAQLSPPTADRFHWHDSLRETLCEDHGLRSAMHVLYCQRHGITGLCQPEGPPPPDLKKK
jgi:hypothetical protein